MAPLLQIFHFLSVCQSPLIIQHQASRHSTVRKIFFKLVFDYSSTEWCSGFSGPSSVNLPNPQLRHGSPQIPQQVTQDPVLTLWCCLLWASLELFHWPGKPCKLELAKRHISETYTQRYIHNLKLLSHHINEKKVTRRN